MKAGAQKLLGMWQDSIFHSLSPSRDSNSPRTDTVVMFKFTHTSSISLLLMWSELFQFSVRFFFSCNAGG
jgi:hypothetical protein